MSTEFENRVRRLRRRARKAGLIVQKFPDIRWPGDSMQLTRCTIRTRCTELVDGRYKLEGGHWRAREYVHGGDINDLEEYLNEMEVA